jgi:hypothetical protein
VQCQYPLGVALLFEEFLTGSQEVELGHESFEVAVIVTGRTGSSHCIVTR